VNSLPKTVTRQSRGCDLNPGPSAPTRLPSHLKLLIAKINNVNKNVMMGEGYDW